MATCAQQAQNRALHREQVERYLATDMTVKEWCGLNHVSESTMYRRMAVFRREESGMFVDPRTASGSSSRAGRSRPGRRWRSGQP